MTRWLTLASEETHENFNDVTLVIGNNFVESSFFLENLTIPFEKIMLTKPTQENMIREMALQQKKKKEQERSTHHPSL